MKHALMIVATAFAALSLSACQSSGGYDGVSRFADTGSPMTAYYGPGSPPRDFGDSGSDS